uniref:Uncharacterized protein n=1 Tax=Plectus sambesii TaxID=2011161 RepID=A0A914XS72_9BILA
MVELVCLKPVLLVIAAILTSVGLGFSIAAIASPSWEVVHMREFQTEHHHGLWLDCARNVKTITSNGEQINLYGKTHCTYKFDYTYGESAMLDDSVPDSENVTHLSYKVFHIAYMIMIALSVISGLTTITVIVGTCRYRNSVTPILLFTMTSLMSTALSSGVFGSYFFVSHSSENRFIKGVTAIYDTDFGDAYYFEQYATYSFFFAFAIGMLLLKLLKYFVNFKSKLSRKLPGASTYSVPESNKPQPFLPVPPYHQFYPEQNLQPPHFIKKLPKSPASEVDFHSQPHMLTPSQEPFLRNYSFPKSSVSSTSSVFASLRSYDADTVSRASISTSNSQTPLLLGLETMV